MKNKIIKILLILLFLTFIFSCIEYYNPYIRIFNMDDTNIRYVYIGSTEFTSIAAHSKSDYKMFEPETYKVKVFLDNTTDFEQEITIDCCRNYTVGIYSNVIDLIEEDK